MPRSKANLNFVFFILRTFFVLKGGWGTATEKNGTKSVVKFVAGPIRNFGNIAGALNSNIPLGPDFAHGLAAMRGGFGGLEKLGNNHRSFASASKNESAAFSRSCTQLKAK